VRLVQPDDAAAGTVGTVTVLDDPGAVARRAASWIAAEARAAAAARGRFTVAVSGGGTPWEMLRALAAQDVPWSRVHLLQADERVAPRGHPDRNLTHIGENLLQHVPLPPGHVHAMPVDAPDLEGAARRYEEALREVAGSPPVLDLVHLGLGSDGHTASLVPEDPALEVTGADVSVTGAYRGRRRMTLTYPTLDRARRVLWLVTGPDKASVFARLLAGDHTIPAGRVRQDRALMLVDRAAAAQCRPG
jgi:6-phosphogluconolactonase